MIVLFCILACRKNFKMSSGVLLACDLNGKKVPKFLLIGEDIGADGSFMVLSLLGNCLKYQENGIVLVCLHHTNQHYLNAGARLGVNMTMAIEKGRIEILEPLTDVGKQFLSSKYLAEPNSDQLEAFLAEINASVEKQLETKENVTIIIDNVSTLHDFGYETGLLTQFCHKLVEMANERISVVIKVNICSLYETIMSSIEDYADSTILISKLKSGEFQEVDGKIDYKKRLANCTHSSKSILYKINDRNIKVFQPGEVGVRS